MLLSKHCPYTGVVNFFEASEPHLAIASITRCGRSAADSDSDKGYTWRFYAQDGAPSGYAPDATSAERKLRAMLAARTGVRRLEYST